jgi:hypothetical protein
VQFRLQTLLLLFVVLWTSLAVFGGAGIVVFLLAIAAALILNKTERLITALLLLSGFLLLLSLLLLPAVQTTGPSRRAQCANNLHQIALAILNYESKWHCFPPACIRDKNGKPMHSWRVLMLPSLGLQDLYDQYSFNEPWDGPNNKKLFASRPRIFTCPRDEAAFNNGVVTSYAAVVGKDALWRPDKPRTFNEPAVSGHAWETVMLVEVGGSGINWLEPRDFSLDELRADGATLSGVKLSCVHSTSNGFFFHNSPGGAVLLLADGHHEYVPAAALGAEKLKQRLSVGGFNAEEAEEVASDARSVNWTNCAALAVWIASVGLLLYRARRSRKTA